MAPCKGAIFRSMRLKRASRRERRPRAPRVAGMRQSAPRRGGNGAAEGAAPAQFKLSFFFFKSRPEDFPLINSAPITP